MTTYVLDITTKPCRDSPPSQGCYAYSMHKYDFKIDINGNVNIKLQHISCCSGHPHQEHLPTEVLVINDNIPIPSYLIYSLKRLISQEINNFYNCHWNSIIETIRQIKINYVTEIQTENIEHNRLNEKIREQRTKYNILKKQLKEAEERNIILEKQLKEAEEKFEAYVNSNGVGVWV